MIEIRELVIRTNVTQNSGGGDRQKPKGGGGSQDNAALEELMKGLNNKNER